MRSIRPLTAAGAVPSLMIALLAGGCATEEEAEPAEAGGAEAPALTRDEIQREAEAMSPAMAESLGIVDTTIRIERPMPAESVRPLQVAPDSGAQR